MATIPSRPALLRTVVLFAAGGMSGCAHAPTAAPTDGALALLDQAIAAAGGRDALAQIDTLAWRGHATVIVPGRRIELLVDTTVKPFVSAESKAVLADKTDDPPQTLRIDRGQAWKIVGDRSEPLPDAQVRHERQQYAVYGLLTWLPLLDASARLRRLPDDPDGHPGLHIDFPKAPPADVYFDAAGRPLYLLDTVDAPYGKGTIAQRFDFSGEVVDRGVHWPQSLRVSQDGKPFFELRIEQFEARR